MLFISTVVSSLKHPCLVLTMTLLFSSLLLLQFSSIIIPHASVPGIKGTSFLYWYFPLIIK